MTQFSMSLLEIKCQIKPKLVYAQYVSPELWNKHGPGWWGGEGGGHCFSKNTVLGMSLLFSFSDKMFRRVL